MLLFRCISAETALQHHMLLFRCINAVTMLQHHMLLFRQPPDFQLLDFKTEISESIARINPNIS